MKKQPERETLLTVLPVVQQAVAVLNEHLPEAARLQRAWRSAKDAGEEDRVVAEKRQERLDTALTTALGFRVHDLDANDLREAAIILNNLRVMIESWCSR